MNPAIKLALKGATGAYGLYRTLDDKKQREVYDALLGSLKDGKLEKVAKDAGIDDLEDLYETAREQAGDLTRDAHARLDRRRAEFAATAPDRKARQAALKAQIKSYENDKKGGAGKVIGGILAAAGLAAGAWAVWEYWLSDVINEKTSKDSKKTTKKSTSVKFTAPAATRTETDKSGKSTLVYSTRTGDASGTTHGTAAGTGVKGSGVTAGTADAAAGRRVSNDPDNDMRPKAAMPGSAGPLGEEPADRDEHLLTSIDEQLTTLDTLEDNQRQATSPTHGDSARSDVLGDTGSGRRSDKVSDADTTFGASGRHELRKDQDDAKK